MEADKGKNLDLVDEEKEQAEIKAAARKWDDIMRSRIDLMRRLGKPVKLFYLDNVDPRILVNRESNSDKIDTGAGPVDEKVLCAKEERIWNLAMDYRKLQNMVSTYDLIPNNMTMYAVMFENYTWYHCNFLGHKKEISSIGGDHVQQRFFVEIKINKGFNYNVVTCVALDDDDIDSKICKICPPSYGIIHPRKGGFVCGSQEGQLIRHYTNVY